MRVVVIHSGGLDSTVLLYSLLDKGYKVSPISFDYGQKHIRETDSAACIWDQLGLLGTRTALPIAELLGGNVLTREGAIIPNGDYDKAIMQQTVVPNRNMIFLAVATAFAISQKAEAVAYAAHAGDHTIYPDCCPEFANVMKRAISLCDWVEIELLAPFIEMTKAQIVRIGAGLKVPFQMTWSCYKGKEKHCGVCGTCIERREAFILANVEDVTAYEVRD